MGGFAAPIISSVAGSLISGMMSPDRPEAPAYIPPPPPPEPAPKIDAPKLGGVDNSLDTSAQVESEAERARALKRRQSSQTSNLTLLGNDSGSTDSSKTLLGQ